jgi:hypothetical protein
MVGVGQLAVSLTHEELGISLLISRRCGRCRGLSASGKISIYKKATLATN